MTLPKPLTQAAAPWVGAVAPCHHIVVSCRARYARNVQDHPFSPHAAPAFLEQVREQIREAFATNTTLATYDCVEMTEVSATERTFLKEARLISKEMERGGGSRAVYVAPDRASSILVNEEDHLRLQSIEPGLQIQAAAARLQALEAEAGRCVPFAWHRRFGYLTACPTNTGTGLRLSAMMHLPGLTLRRDLEAVLTALPPRGLTVRGFHGENSESQGDFHQISNEVTLGRTVEEIAALLAEAVAGVMEKEVEARSLLHSRSGIGVQDSVWRSYGVLTHARKMDSTEAMKLLSRLRLGIDQGFFPHLTHEALNRAFIEVQPSHLVLRHGSPEAAEERDVARATLLRRLLCPPGAATA